MEGCAPPAHVISSYIFHVISMHKSQISQGSLKRRDGPNSESSDPDLDVDGNLPRILVAHIWCSGSSHHTRGTEGQSSDPDYFKALRSGTSVSFQSIGSKPQSLDSDLDLNSSGAFRSDVLVLVYLYFYTFTSLACVWSL